MQSSLALMEIFTVLFRVYQQLPPKGEVIHLIEVLDVEARSEADAIAQCRQWPKFARAQGLARFPIVQEAA